MGTSCACRPMPYCGSCRCEYVEGYAVDRALPRRAGVVVGGQQPQRRGQSRLMLSNVRDQLLSSGIEMTRERVASKCSRSSVGGEVGAGGGRCDVQGGVCAVIARAVCRSGGAPGVSWHAAARHRRMEEGGRAGDAKLCDASGGR